MPSINKINHIAILVEDIQAALAFWRDALGLDLRSEEDVPNQQARVAFLPVGESQIELVMPTSQDSGLARHLAKRGSGMHHICFEVPDIRVALASLKAKDVRLINETPLTREDGRLYAFIHPQSAHGVLVELYQLPSQEADA